MKIVFAASEAAPYIKTGGLADVAQALPAALAKHAGVRIALFVPYYPAVRETWGEQTETVRTFNVKLGWRNQTATLRRLVSKSRKLRVYFIENDYYFKRDTVYGCADDGERFAYFSMAILESLVQLREVPDVIHCNDWQTALIPTLLHAFYQDRLGSAKTVFTIHNIEYQGWVDPYFLGDVLGLPDDYDSAFRFGSSHNFMKSAILKCDALTTVSETYAREICDPYYAHGLDDVIREHSFKLTGILNGIDTDVNDPSSDPFLAKRYGSDTFREGKAACKAALQRETGLPVRPDVPVIGMVTRLVSHKGLDVLCERLESLLEWDVQLVILGTGDPYYEVRLRNTAACHADRFALCLGFSKELASRIYGGADLFLMPSKSEPCGLSQLIAMRYGTVPVVHETGGLKDTVIPYDPSRGKGLGFTFYDFTGDQLLDAVGRALRIWWDNCGEWDGIVRNDMTEDVSWSRSAARYLDLYGRLAAGS